jgi:uncharacterized membrane protein YphA (DoxX/SURF4 family)
MSRVKSVFRVIAVWLPTVLLALLFAQVGVIKFVATETWAGMFAAWGYPAGFHLVIGALELAGGLCLLVPRISAYAALMLAVIMAGAVLTHAVHGELSRMLFTAGLTAVLLGLARFRLRRRSASMRAATAG